MATKDNPESWGMCATSVECRTIMTVVLMITSGINPYAIRETWVGMVGLLEVCKVMSFRLNHRSGLCGTFDVAFEEKSF
jgi:hypothetical protein